jgi:hypothetical protein
VADFLRVGSAFILPVSILDLTYVLPGNFVFLSNMVDLRSVFAGLFTGYES